MSHNQPGPYGQQPPQGPPPGQPGPYGAPPPQGPPPGGPNPYAQPGGAPGYGYPQQQPPQQPYGGQPQPPYGAPQQPGYGQQPPPPAAQYPGQPQYGQMPPAPPAKGGGKKTGMIVGAVVAAAAVGAGLYFVLSGGDKSIGADDGTRYDLQVPPEFGDFTLVEEGGTEDVLPDEEALAQNGVEYTDSVSGQYATSMDEEELLTSGGTALVFGGMWGEISHPQQTVDGLFHEIALALTQTDDPDVNVELIGSPQSYSEDDVALSCQQVKETSDDEDMGPIEVTGAICVWADYGTLGATAMVNSPTIDPTWNPETSTEPPLKMPDAVSTSRGADITKQLRSAAQVERAG